MAGRGEGIQGAGRDSTCCRINVGFEPDEGHLPRGPARRSWKRLCLARKRTAAGPQPTDASGTQASVRTRRSQIILVPVSATAIREGAGPIAARQCTGQSPCRRILPDDARVTSSTSLPHYPQLRRPRGLTPLKKATPSGPGLIPQTVRAHRDRPGRTREPERPATEPLSTKQLTTNSLTYRIQRIC